LLKRRSFFHSLLNTFLIIAGFSFIFYQLHNKDVGADLVYIDTSVVFSKFNMVKELQASHRPRLQGQKVVVDSIVSELQSLTVESSLKEELESRFVSENNRLRQLEEYFSQELNQKVWTRLGSYVKEYGKSNGYTIVLSTQGFGSVMYSEEALDITDDFILYVNKKYEGGTASL